MPKGTPQRAMLLNLYKVKLRITDESLEKAQKNNRIVPGRVVVRVLTTGVPEASEMAAKIASQQVGRVGHMASDFVKYTTTGVEQLEPCWLDPALVSLEDE